MRFLIYLQNEKRISCVYKQFSELLEQREFLIAKLFVWMNIEYIDGLNSSSPDLAHIHHITEKMMHMIHRCRCKNDKNSWIS